MHSHIHAVSPNLLNQYSATELYRTATAQRANEVRKRLLEVSREIEFTESAEARLMIPRRSESDSQRRRGQKASGLKSGDVADDLDQVVEPISVWA